MTIGDFKSDQNLLVEVSAHFPLQNLDNTHHGILDSGSLEVSQEPLEDLIFGALAVQIERVLLHVVDTLQEMTVYLHFYRFVKLFFSFHQCLGSAWPLCFYVGDEDSYGLK